MSPRLNACRANLERYNGINQITIDERIEALTARHEALTQSVELLGSFHRDTEEAMRKLDEKLTENMSAVASQVGQLATHMNTIAQFVIGHEQRMQKLESGH